MTPTLEVAFLIVTRYLPTIGTYSTGDSAGWYVWPDVLSISVIGLYARSFIKYHLFIL